MTSAKPAAAGPLVPAARPDQWWTDRHNANVQNSKKNPNIPIVFFGDSITEGWGGEGHTIFDEKYAPLRVANYGVRSDRVEHLIWRIQNGEVQGLAPKLVVLMIGTNNLESATPADIAQGIKLALTELRARLPNSKILLLGILPRADVKNAFALISDVNKKIAELDNGSTIRYLNMFDSFVASPGAIDAALFATDGVHVGMAGYKKWNQLMDPLFQEMKK